MTVSLNYKAQFQKNETLAKAHRELVVTDAFQVAVEMALLQYMSSQIAKDSVSDAMSLHRILGAEEFVKVLLNLAEPPQLPQKKTEIGLKYGN